jgi:hypothetical protein
MVQIMAAVMPRFLHGRSCLVGYYTAYLINCRHEIAETRYAMFVVIFLYKPTYNIAYDALTYVYVV